MVTFLARYAASTGKEIASQVDLSSFPDSELTNPGEVVLDVENVTMHSAQHKKDCSPECLFSGARR